MPHLPRRSGEEGQGLIPTLSRFLCRLLPNCDEDTVSAQIAENLDTTIQGAHTWIVSSYLDSSNPLVTQTSLQSGAEAVVRFEVPFALREQGPQGIVEILRFVPPNARIRPELERAFRTAIGEATKSDLGEFAFIRRNGATRRVLRELSRLPRFEPQLQITPRRLELLTLGEAERFEVLTGRPLPDAPMARSRRRLGNVGVAVSLASLPGFTIGTGEFRTIPGPARPPVGPEGLRRTNDG